MLPGMQTAPARLVGHHENLALAACGGTPVGLIAASTFGIELRALALLVLAPLVLCLVARMAVDRQTRTIVGRAIVLGVVATALYDLWRGSVLWAGLMDHDPIPHIGTALGLEPAWVAGYAWRYLGNGTGLALAFLAFGLRGARAGVVYGLTVCACLLLTLLVSPYGTAVLFPLNATTIVMATVGHAIYGAALGMATARGGLSLRRAAADTAVWPLCANPRIPTAVRGWLFVSRGS
jgi:hypothetical protein